MNQEVSEQEAVNDGQSPQKKKPKAIWLIGILALAVVIAVGTSYYMFRLLGAASGTVANFSSEISDNQQEIDELEASVEEHRENMLEVSETLTGADLRLRRQLDELTDAIDQVRAQQQAQHQQMLAMTGNQAAANSSWQQAEIVHLLQIANERLTLAKDPASALAALLVADQRIAALGDPGLTPVRAQVAEEIRSLEAVRAPDIEGAILKLDALASGLPKLALRGPGRVAASDEPELEDDEGFSMRRAFSKFGDAFSGMVKVSKTSDEAAALLSPDEQFYLRNNIVLQFDMARLSALSRDQASYEQSLGQAKSWIDEYFVGSDSATSSALSTIDELSAVILSPALPDISASLRLMQAAVTRPQAATEAVAPEAATNEAVTNDPVTGE